MTHSKSKAQLKWFLRKLKIDYLFSLFCEHQQYVEEQGYIFIISEEDWNVVHIPRLPEYKLLGTVTGFCLMLNKRMEQMNKCT